MQSGNLSIVIEHEGFSLLVDASGSPGQALRSFGIDPLELDAVLITHGHCDHTYAFPSLIQDMVIGNRRKPLRILGNGYALTVCKALIALYKFDNKPNLMPLSWEEAGETTIKLNDAVSLCWFTLFHRPHMPTNGFVCFTDGEKLAYFPDSVATTPYPASAMHADILIHEAGGVTVEQQQVNKNGHSTARQAAEVAQSLGALRLVLCHLPLEECFHAAIHDDARTVSPQAELPELGIWYRVGKTN